MRTLDEIRQAAAAVHGHTDDPAVEMLAELIAELAHHVADAPDEVPAMTSRVETWRRR